MELSTYFYSFLKGATKDDTAVNSVRLYCAGNSSWFVVHDGYRGSWQEKGCGANQKVCGMRTRTTGEFNIAGDDAGTVAVTIKCCQCKPDRGTKVNEYRETGRKLNLRHSGYLIEYVNANPAYSRTLNCKSK